MSPTLSKMASSSSLAAIIQPTWSSTALRPTPTLQDRAMDEDKVLKQQGSPLADNTAPSLPSSNSSATLTVSHPPLFGSTSHKLGMNMDMAILNHTLHQEHTAHTSKQLLTLIDQPFEKKLPNPIKSGQYLRRASLLAPISELPEKLAEEDLECRRQSQATKYWTSAKDHDLWQQMLVTQLVRAEHARLDERQGALLRYARQLVRAEEVELWYRRRELGKLHEKQKKKRKQLRRQVAAIKKRAAEEGNEELLKKMARLSL
ncbi:hypothetical protein F5Y13DRAFT_193909 [Hypoxylon sp. FL1857]|nr:hypothetical protein F5Y13DRAFT_193909 [Hypoxylon sp. FL1857]